jgi:predicted nucleic acid-binding protein
MKQTFADTFFYLALVNPQDTAHKLAVSKAAALSSPLITTQWVLTEVADALCSAANRHRFLALWELVTNDDRVEIVPASDELFERGVELYRQRADKNWSLTDCTSFVVMKARRLTDALTADHHFEQAGFKILLDPGKG